MSSKPKSKSRRSTRTKKGSMSSAHWVGYVDDRESIESIMSKFQKLDKVIERKKTELGTDDDISLNQNDLEDLFRQTSKLTISQLQDPYFLAEEADSDFWSDSDDEYSGSRPRSRSTRKKRTSKSSKSNVRDILIPAELTDETGRVITYLKKAKFRTPLDSEYVKIPSPPLSLTWCYTVTPFQPFGSSPKIISANHTKITTIPSKIDTILNTQYKAILMDPPFQCWKKSTPLFDDSSYISIQEFGAINIPSLIPDGHAALLFIWTPKQHLAKMIHIASNWGFRYVENFCWIKQDSKNGFEHHPSEYFKACGELLIIFHRHHSKKQSSLELRHQRSSDVWLAPTRFRTDKITPVRPDYTYHLIETLLPKCGYDEKNPSRPNRFLHLWAPPDELRQGWDTVSVECTLTDASVRGTRTGETSSNITKRSRS